MSNSAAAIVAGLRGVAPYIHLHRNATFVVQVDTSRDAERDLRTLVEDLALLHSLGVRLVLTYGARAQVEARMAAGETNSECVQGLRVTTAEQLACVQQEASRVRVALEAGFSVGLPNTPMAGAALHVCSGNFVQACPVGVRDGVDHLYTGRVRRVDTGRLNARLSEGGIVLIPPLGYSLTGEAFNLNAVETAAAIAVALQAEKLLYLVRGSLRGPDGSVVRELDLQQAERCLATGAHSPTDDKLWCLRHGLHACKQGVSRVHIIDRQCRDALLLELYSRDGAATMLSATRFDELRPANAGDAGSILALIRPLEEEGLLTKRSLEQLERRFCDYTVMVRDGAVIACGSLRVYAERNVAEIECLAVHTDYRDREFGSLLYEALERAALRAQVTHLYALTTGAAHWFLARGFTECTATELPTVRRAEYDLTRASKVLVKRLEAPSNSRVVVS